MKTNRAVAARVYRSIVRSVNATGPKSARNAAKRCLALLLAPILLGGVGCRTVERPVRPASLIAIRYDHLLRQLARPQVDAAATLARDLETLSSMGFDALVLPDVPLSQRVEVLDRVGDAGLRAALSDRRINRYLNAGLLPRGIQSPEELLTDYHLLARRHEAFAGLVLELSPSAAPDAERRLDALAASLDARGMRYWVVHAPSPVPGLPATLLPARPRELVRVVAGVSTSETGHPVEEWLAQVHHGLLRGATAGVMLDRAHRLPGDPPGLVDVGPPLPPAAGSAVTALLDRARAWLPRLAGMRCRVISAPAGRSTPAGRSSSTTLPSPADRSTPESAPSAEIVAALFQHGPARYLLLFNPSTEHFARGEWTLPAVIDGSRPERAVEVVERGQSRLGRVLPAGPGGVTIPYALRPGDAVLYELF